MEAEFTPIYREQPVFADVDEQTWTLDVDNVREKISGSTKAIMPVHLFGQCADIAPLRALADERGLALIEDSAQAWGSTYNGAKAGKTVEVVVMRDGKARSLTVTMEELGGAKIHSEVSGVADLVAKNDEECLALIRRLLGFLPSNFETAPPRKETADDPTRALETLEKIVPEDMRRAYNMLQVIKVIVDDGDFLELKAKFARNLVIGLGRLDGCPVGFVADHLEIRWDIDHEAQERAAELGLELERIEMPNAEPAFVAVLARLVRQALPVPSSA